MQSTRMFEPIANRYSKLYALVRDEFLLAQNITISQIFL